MLKPGALLALVLPLLAVAPSAQAAVSSPGSIAVLGVDAPIATTAHVARAVDRDCVAGLRQGAGTATRGYLAPADGELQVRLRGARGAGDWDLAIFERTSGKRVASSAGFGADEVATLTVRKDASLILQACRRDGAAETARITTRLTRLDLSTVTAVAGKVSLVEVPLEGRGALARLEATGLD